MPPQQPYVQPLDSTLPQTVPPVDKSKNNLRILLAIALGACLVLGIIAYFLYNKKTAPIPTTNQPTTPIAMEEIKLPSDVVLVQDCANQKGALYTRPADIPLGPTYLVYNNKVVGIEYMLPKSDLLEGKSFDNLSVKNAKVDHVNVGLQPHGHAGNPDPHYHVDMYLVPKSTEEMINCPEETNMESSNSGSIMPKMMPSGSPGLP